MGSLSSEVSPPMRSRFGFDDAEEIIDLPTVLIALTSLGYLWRLKFRLKEPTLVLLTAGVGLLLHGT
jgi:hypothetical protein